MDQAEVDRRSSAGSGLAGTASAITSVTAAAALFLSPKTIEYHLRHVYLKLGIHSREELARALPGSSPSPEAADVEAGGMIELGR